MRLKWFLIALLCAMLVPSLRAKPKGLGTVGGQVVDTGGRAVPGARVTLQASDGRDSQITETNQQGRFWFASLPEGQYDVRAYRKGRISEWRQNVWVSPGHQTNVTLHLRPKKSARH
jgi:protocatechuate 3,4-dioxygenase beta subunit